MTRKYIFGRVISNDFGIVTIKSLYDHGAFRKGESVMVKGRHKFQQGDLVGFYVNENSRLERVLALVEPDSSGVETE